MRWSLFMRNHIGVHFPKWQMALQISKATVLPSTYHQSPEPNHTKKCV